MVPLIEIKELQKSYEDIPVIQNISFKVYNGEFLTLLGPSGCGKTTLLRLISGFEQPDSGIINFNDKNINNLPPQKRNFHTIFQSYALFPHLNVYENVAFALRCQKVNNQIVSDKVLAALKLVRLEAYTNRSIGQLSGGQQQRIAIARAIVNRPQVLLLDEPLSSLDYRLRKEMQYELKQLQQKLDMTFIFVTHDQEEALSMSDRIVILNGGIIQQIGTPREVYENPQNMFVAKFIGEANIFDAVITERSPSKVSIKIESVDITCKNTHDFHVNDHVHLIVRPEDVRILHQNKVDDHEGMILGNIINIVYKGSTVDLKVALKSGKIINATAFFDEDDEDLAYSINESVWVHWPYGWEVLLPYEN